jgi:hypothetical protein
MRAYRPWSLLEVLRGDDPAWLDDTCTIQPALFAVQVALAAMWRHRGIVPDVVVGHSMGEIAAAHVAGVLTLEDATRIVCERSTVVAAARGKGRMALVGVDWAGATRALVADDRDGLSLPRGRAIRPSCGPCSRTGSTPPPRRPRAPASTGCLMGSYGRPPIDNNNNFRPYLTPTGTLRIRL